MYPIRLINESAKPNMHTGTADTEKESTDTIMKTHQMKGEA